MQPFLMKSSSLPEQSAKYYFIIHLILGDTTVEMIMGVTSSVIAEIAVNLSAPVPNHGGWPKTAVLSTFLKQFNNIFNRYITEVTVIL